MRALALALALALAAAPAASVADAERAETLRSAAEALRGAIRTLEDAAATLEEAAREERQAQTDEAADADGDEAAAEEDSPDATGDGEVVFLDPLNDEPLDIPTDGVTDAVLRFHETAENPYDGDEAAAAEGEKLYAKLCAACHLKDGTGRIGPNLVDDTWSYDRAGTDKGQFELLWAGGAGAMQAFSKRISQDEMLKVIAYLDVLGEE